MISVVFPALEGHSKKGNYWESPAARCHATPGINKDCVCVSQTCTWRKNRHIAGGWGGGGASRH